MSPRGRTEVELFDWRAIVAALSLAALSLGLTWTIAVPSGFFVCPAIDPPPTNCRPEFRAGTASVVSAGVLVMMIGTVFAALKGPMWRFASGAGLVILFLAPLVAWAVVALSPGFLLR